jgi:large subunit ribosomal protein L6
MSRLAKKPIKIPENVTVAKNGEFLTFKGPLGELKLKVARGVNVKIEPENIWIESSGGRSLRGTIWALVRNAVSGVAGGFSKVLEMEGIGYRAQVEEKNLVLSLGYAEPVNYKIPDEVKVEVEKNAIKISGIDKNLVGKVAAEIRALKKPEPYKGKGIHYRGEVIRKKVGKRAAAATGAAGA